MSPSGRLSETGLIHRKMTVYLNGEFIPEETASLSPSDRGFLFGDGAYEVVIAYRGAPFEFAAHVARLARLGDLHGPVHGDDRRARQDAADPGAGPEAAHREPARGERADPEEQEDEGGHRPMIAHAVAPPRRASCAAWRRRFRSRLWEMCSRGF